MAGSQIATSVTRLESMLGFQALSLTEFATSALSAIAAGSKVEIAGAMFTFATDETINASSWTAITTATSPYIALTPSGSAGTQIVSAAYTATAPVWSTSKQGWYASAASSTRIIASVYKTSDTIQGDKYLYSQLPSGKQSRFTKGTTPNGTIHNNAPTTADQLFTTLNRFIPVTGDLMIISGSLNTASVLSIVSQVERYSTTEMLIWCTSVAVASSTITADWITLTDGSASAYSSVSFSW